MTKALIVKEDGLIYAAEVPEEPKSCRYSALCHMGCECMVRHEEWERTLASAKESAVLVSDQEKARELICYELYGGPQVDIPWKITVKNHSGKFFDIPDLQLEVKEELIGVASNVTPFGSVSEFRKVAILRESTPSTGQPQTVKKKQLKFRVIHEGIVYEMPNCRFKVDEKGGLSPLIKDVNGVWRYVKADIEFIEIADWQYHQRN